MKQKSPLAYLRAHWRGEQGIGWSFWVNLVALRLVITIGHGAVTSALGPDNKIVLFALGILIHGVIFVWQTVGVLRAADQHIRDLGGLVATWGVQVGLLVALWLTLADVWQIWIVTHPPEPQLQTGLAFGQEPINAAKLSVVGETLGLNGEITLALIRRTTKMLESNPQITVLDLQSRGGNVYGARGLAKLVRDNGLDTYVGVECLSACTIIFIAGESRGLEQGALLGFHQYRVDANYPVPFTKPGDEQVRDRAAFGAAGVAGWFLDRLFLSPSANMWFPSRDQLQSANVVTR